MVVLSGFYTYTTTLPSQPFTRQMDVTAIVYCSMGFGCTTASVISFTAVSN